MFFRHLTATDRSQEVIQPQIPLRLPCYDLTLLAKFRFESGTLSGPSPIPHSDGLTGGVCKEQGRIHRAMLRRDYYAFVSECILMDLWGFEPQASALQRQRSSS